MVFLLRRNCLSLQPPENENDKQNPNQRGSPSLAQNVSRHLGSDEGFRILGWGVDPNFTLKKPWILALFYCHQTGLWAAQGWSLWPRWGGFLLGTGPKCANFERDLALVFLVKSSMLTLNPPQTQIINHLKFPFKKRRRFSLPFYGCSNGGRRWGWHSSLGGLCQQCCRDLGQMVRRGWDSPGYLVGCAIWGPHQKKTQNLAFFSTKFDTFVGKLI